MMQVRASIVGCGSQGVLHAAALARHGATIVAVCDLDDERADRLARHYGARPFSGADTMFRETVTDLVTICTMGSTHAEISLQALSAGAHVFCEKPFTMNVAEAVEVCRRANTVDRRLSVDFNMRHTRQAAALKAHMATPGFGTPVCARAWAKSEAIPWWGRHYHRADSGGGAIASTAVHLLDMALWLAQFPEPISVSAAAARTFPGKRGRSAPTSDAANEYDVEDCAAAFIRCADGFWMTLEGSWVWNRPAYDYGLELSTSTGQLELTPLRVTLDTGDGYRSVVEDADTDLRLEDSVDRSIGAFMKLVNGDASGPIVTMREAVMVQAVTDAIYLSAQRQTEVRIRDVWSEFVEEGVIACEP